MPFKDYYNESWSKHADDAESVFNSFKDNLDLPETANDVVLFGNLIVHVSGEHLKKWNEGIELLNTLEKNPLHTDRDAFKRYNAILNLGADEKFDITSFSDSDQTRILAVVASSLTSEEYLKKACALAEKLEKTDPAMRTLAVTGNGIASELEEKTPRSEVETELMKFAAHTARKYWEIAGSWKEVERAEYRLAHTYLKAGELAKAKIHAIKCLSIVEENNNEALEEFFGCEVLAKIEKESGYNDNLKEVQSRMSAVYDRLAVGDRMWCKEYLDKIESL